MIALRSGSRTTIRTFAALCGLHLFGLMTQPAFAQNEHPRLEIFGGASYLPANGQDFPRNNSVGFQTSVSGNLNRWFGIVGDVGGQYSANPDTSVYEYLAGPRFTKRTRRVSLFAHFLVGASAGQTSVSGFSDKGLSLGGGGGFDINVSRRIAIRPLQLDYIGSFVDILEDNIRFGSGVVIKLGGN